MLDPCPPGLAWSDPICHSWLAKSFASAANTARDQVVCSADFVVTLPNMFDCIQQICGALGSRLSWFLLSHSLNGVGSNQSVNGIRQRDVEGTANGHPVHAFRRIEICHCAAMKYKQRETDGFKECHL
jgi:hypothetical protein